MANRRTQFRALSQTGPAASFVAVTPDDGAELPDGLTRSLFVGTAGLVAIENADGNTVVIKSGDSQYHPLRTRKIYATGTTATDIVAIY